MPIKLNYRYTILFCTILSGLGWHALTAITVFPNYVYYTIISYNLSLRQYFSEKLATEAPRQRSLFRAPRTRSPWVPQSPCKEISLNEASLPCAY